MKRRKQGPARVRQMLQEVFSGDVHATRVRSIANTVAAVMVAALVAIHAVGRALAKVTGVTPKSAIKQVDRLLSNTGFTMEAFFKLWVRFVVGVRQQIVVALDWTEFDADTPRRGTYAATLATGVFAARLRGARRRSRRCVSGAVRCC